MLSGVLFRRGTKGTETEGEETIQPEFINQYIKTDLYLSTIDNKAHLRPPILPSIATLIDPASTLFTIMFSILRAAYLIFLTHLQKSKQVIRRISVANTGITYHDGRALATCESGPLMRIQLPELETIGWYNDGVAEGEPGVEEGATMGKGLTAFMDEWTTGHPKVDPVTNELILFHAISLPPYVRYSVTPATEPELTKTPSPCAVIRRADVPGVSGARMMHDFGVSRNHTVIMDLPLSLDPMNAARGKPVVLYEPDRPSRFGVFPRHSPAAVRWFETSACCIFHTANTWDEYDAEGNLVAVNLLACRLNSASVVFSAANIVAPSTRRKQRPSIPHQHDSKRSSEHWLESGLDRSKLSEKTKLLAHDTPSYDSNEEEEEEEHCFLHHFRFLMSPSASDGNIITHSRPLSSLPFEFPIIRPDRCGQFARYVYGCSTRSCPTPSSSASFGTALGRTAKIDLLVKVDVAALLARGSSATTNSSSKTCIDPRSGEEILALREQNKESSEADNDAIKCFAMPPNWFAQEAFFVPSNTTTDEAEDSGHLLFYAFDESQLPTPSSPWQLDTTPPPSAVSELWILDARNMRDVVCRIKLPQRVPYGLHGRWFSEEEVVGQRVSGPVFRGAKSESEASEKRKDAEQGTMEGVKNQGWDWSWWCRALITVLFVIGVNVMLRAHRVDGGVGIRPAPCEREKVLDMDSHVY
jgi:carotenoid cleavage dioxygenase-like enzyme